MNLSRRKAMGLLGAIPVVGPAMAAKLQNEAKASSLIGMMADGRVFEPPPLTEEATDIPAIQRNLMLQIPWVKEQLEEVIRERTRYIGSIDPDLAVLKSISLSAKIYYQRQRTAKRLYDDFGKAPSYYKNQNLIRRAKKLVGL